MVGKRGPSSGKVTENQHGRLDIFFSFLFFIAKHRVALIWAPVFSFFFYSRPPKTSFNSGHECTWRVGKLYVVDIKQAGMTNEKHRTWKRSNFRYWPFDNAQRGSTCFRAWSVTRPAAATIKSAERTFVSLYLPIDIHIYRESKNTTIMSFAGIRGK